MRKRLIAPFPDSLHPQKGWLDLDRLAVVEVTSGDEERPVEATLVLEETGG